MATQATAGSQQSINTEPGVPGRGGGYKREMGKGRVERGLEGAQAYHMTVKRGGRGGEGGLTSRGHALQPAGQYKGWVKINILIVSSPPLFPFKF